MKKIFFVSALSCVLSAASAIACPGDQFSLHQVALDANGVLTRSELREVPARDFDESQKTVMANVVVDKITLESGDEIKLNAAPGIVDATVFVTVKRTNQKADAAGIFSTTYLVRQTMTSGWGGGTTEKSALVTVKSTYLGDGKSAKGCGSVDVKELPKNPGPISKH